MVGREQSKRLDITVSSGTGTGTLTGQWDVARWIRIVPPNESASFDISFKDGDGYLILDRDSNTGTYSERVEISLGILKSIEISGATVDGTYVCLFDMH